MNPPHGKRIAICGLVRDCKAAVERHWHHLQELGSDGHQLHWVFVENDSIDGSREWLESISHLPNVAVLGENTGELTIPQSTPGTVIPAFSISTSVFRLFKRASSWQRPTTWRESFVPMPI